MKVLFEDEGSYIIEVLQDKYLLIDLDDPKIYRYASTPEVFLRFMPYAEEFTGKPEPVLVKVRGLMNSGKLPATDHDGMNRPPQR